MSAATSPVRASSQARNGRFARSAPAFELLESKLRAPQLRGRAVPRKALIELLEESDTAPVVSLSAGPGWGKTTLLAQWRARSRRPFAWVSIDENDNDPIVLLTYVAAALNRVSQLDASVFYALGASIEGPVVARVAAALATMDDAVVLVLDDLHFLHNPRCLAAVAELTRHVPEGSQLVLSARGRLELPLGALRARGLAVEIGDDELRLDEAEAHQLLSAAGLDLTPAEVAELTEHTEGWCAGLYLAALSAKRNGATGAIRVRGDDRFVAEYLRSEVLSRLPHDELRFLTGTAVLERMSGSLCDAVLDSSGSAAELESLARSSLFVVPLDSNGHWYRYHHLFRELLRAELERAEPDLVPRLLARAVAWSAANGQTEAAIGYAQEAGDVDQVSRLVEQCVLPTYESGRFAAVERWLGWLEAHGALERNAAVAVLGALLAAIWGRPVAAERWADAAERATYDGVLPDGSPLVDSWLALLRAQLCRRGAARMRGDAELALRTVAAESPFRTSASLLLAISHVLLGDVERADDLLADVADEGLELGAVDVVAVALGQRAAIAIARRAWVQAEGFTDRALHVIRRSGMDAFPTSAFVYAVAARVALHREETQRAQELLTRAQELRPRLTYALPYLAVQTRLELARAYLAQADALGAETMLREIDAVLRRRPALEELPAQVEELRASLTAMRGDAPGASALTEAELRVLPYLATHLSFREIGERVYLSRHTVKSHAIAIYRKLNATSRNAAVERACELGLLENADAGQAFMPSGR